MPSLSCWMVRLSLVYLLVGATLGGMMLVSRATGMWTWVWAGYKIHTEWLWVGWFVQFALGVAYWIFPRFAQGQRPQSALMWSGWAALQVGILGVCVSHLTPLWGISKDALYVASRAIQLGAWGMFVWHLWPRIKPFGGKPA